MKERLFNTPNSRVPTEPYSVRPGRCAIAVEIYPSTHETGHYGHVPADAPSHGLIHIPDTNSVSLRVRDSARYASVYL